MLHILCSRDPSQKLSNPVPRSGFPVMSRTRFHIAVRPVSVGSRSTMERSSGATKMAPSDRHRKATTRIWTTARLRKNAHEFVPTSSTPAAKEQESEVMEFVIQKSQQAVA